MVGSQNLLRELGELRKALNSYTRAEEAQKALMKVWMLAMGAAKLRRSGGGRGVRRLAIGDVRYARKRLGLARNEMKKARNDKVKMQKKVVKTRAKLIRLPRVTMLDVEDADAFISIVNSYQYAGIGRIPPELVEYFEAAIGGPYNVEVIE